jgi:hypothetical protein
MHLTDFGKAAECSGRDEFTCTGLQSQTGNQHPRHSKDHRATAAIAKPVCPHVMKNHSFHTAAAESGPSFSEKLTNLDVRFYRESGHSAKIALKGR